MVHLLLNNMCFCACKIILHQTTGLVQRVLFEHNNYPLVN